MSICKICYRSIDGENEYWVHQIREHNEMIPLDVYGSRMNTKIQPIDKKLSSNIGYSLPCGRCDKEFRTKVELKRHNLIYHKVVKRNKSIYRCNKCNFVYVNYRSLLQHMKSHIH